MKSSNQSSQKGIVQSIIPIVLAAFLFSISFHSCQKEENILEKNQEYVIPQSNNLKSIIYPTEIDILIIKIEDYVTNGDLKQGIANAMISKLTNAKKSIEKGNEKLAVNSIFAIVQQLESLIINGIIDSAIGEDIIFDVRLITGENPIFIDVRDNKEYKTIRIGEQIWLAENLDYQTATGCWTYDNDENNLAIYGKLYNWNAALTASPYGWHLPSDDEWIKLSNYLINNGYGYEGSGDDIAKALAATTYWIPSTIPGTPGYDLELNNSSGFSGLPGGIRYPDESFNLIGNLGNWWSSTESGSSSAWHTYMFGSSNMFWKGAYFKESGLSVRCLRD